MSSPTAESLLGSALIITVLSFGLYGITVVQTFSYVCNVQDDTKLLKWLVVFIILLETLLSAFELHVIYFFTVSAWGDLTSVNTIPWTVPGCVVVTNFIVILVQGFYIRRLWHLSGRNVYLISTAGFALAARIILPWVSVVIQLKDQAWSDFEGKELITWTIEAGCIVSALADAFTTGCLIYFVRRSQSGCLRTDTVARSIIIYAINTGVVSMLVSICTAVTFMTLKHNEAYASLILLLGRSYANSFLGTLNTRASYQSQLRSNVSSNSEELT